MQNGHEVWLCAPDIDNTTTTNQKGIKLIKASFNPSGINPFREIFSIISFMLLLNSIKPDVVLSFTLKPNLYSLICSKILKLKSIINISGLGSIFIENKFLAKASKFIFRNFQWKNSIFFFQNSSDKDFFNSEKIGINKSYLIPGSGIDLNKFPYKKIKNNPQKISFLFIGRILKDKGLIELIEAFKLLRQENGNINLNIIGAFYKGNPSAISESEFKELIRTDGVRYWAHQDNVKNFIYKSDFIVLPSYREGLSRTLLEAAACGRPIITTDVPGCRELISDNGFLCLPKDISSLKNAMKKASKLDTNEKNIMGLNGRHLVEKNYDIKKVIKKYLEKIEDN